MVLSDVTLREYIENGRLEVEPLSDNGIQPASIDLCLGRNFRVFEYSRETFVDPRDRDRTYTRPVEIEEGGEFVLHPGKFVLGTTRERIKVPKDLVGKLEGRSSLGRLGVVVHATAGHINPGFEGEITLELSNVGSLPVKLFEGMAICQISFLLLTCEVAVAYGHESLGSRYQNQAGATESLSAD